MYDYDAIEHSYVTHILHVTKDNMYTMYVTAAAQPGKSQQQLDSLTGVKWRSIIMSLIDVIVPAVANNDYSGHPLVPWSSSQN